MADQSDKCEPISCWPPDGDEGGESDAEHVDDEHKNSALRHISGKTGQATDIIQPMNTLSQCIPADADDLFDEEIKTISMRKMNRPDDYPPVKRKKSTIDEPLATVALAKWWRTEGQVICTSESSMPSTHNPNNILRYAARTKEGISFMRKEIARLKALLRIVTECAEIHAAIGTFCEKLNEYDDAVHHLNEASRLDSNNKEYKWLLRRVSRQQRILKIQKTQVERVIAPGLSMPVPVQVERRSASSLTFCDFMTEYAMQSKPVIITDIVNKMTTHPWSLDHIDDIAGKCQVALKHRVPGSVEWAQLETSHTTTVSHFIAKLSDAANKENCSDYLFDWSLPIYCPKLAEELTIPKYFAGDFLQRTPPGSLYRDSWPSLFIAPANVRSELHVDTFGSNFWMALFTGRKRWIFFLPKDLPLLYPKYEHSMDPVFEVDLSNPDLSKFPLLAQTEPQECMLEPGEVLFVPAGCPHRVETLETSIAVSANFVDLSNVELVKAELEINALTDDRSAALLSQIDGMDMRMDSTVENLTFTQFKEPSSDQSGFDYVKV